MVLWFLKALSERGCSVRDLPVILLIPVRRSKLKTNGVEIERMKEE